VYDKGKKIVIALPGPPRELIPMVKTNLIPFLQGRLKLKRPASSRSFHFCCIGESNVDQIVREKLGGETDLTVSLLAQLGLVNLTLSLPDDNQESQERLSRYADTIRGELGTFLYSETDETLEQTVGELLKQRLDTLSVAESCTGGLLGEKITSVPGASIYFLGGVISYSNRAKETHLKVNTETLRIHGAVSRETACEMARGIQSTFQSRWGVAITGIAGPEGGTPEKPVGTVWIAVSDPNGKAFPFRIQFPGDRDAIRHRSCIFALDQLRRLLLKIDPHSTS
jgi:nicotinamide-nucleotide amidase